MLCRLVLKTVRGGRTVNVILPQREEGFITKKMWKKLPVKAQVILVGVLVVVCAIVAVFGYRAVDNMLHPQATLTNSVVARQLEKIQDLTTAKETDFGFEEYKEGNIAR